MLDQDTEVDETSGGLLLGKQGSFCRRSQELLALHEKKSENAMTTLVNGWSYGPAVLTHCIW